PVGGGAAVSIQTMAKAAPSDLDRIVAQLTAARRAGCDIARVAVPDMAAAGSIGELKARCGLPIVADVHFDYRLAVAAAEAGADGLRVNPGNLGGERKLEAVVEAAAEAGIPIRVGVNAGSMPKEGGERLEATAENMVASALAMAQRIERLGHDAIKVSLKAFDLQTMVAACRRFAERSDIPLHLGLTEAGLPLSGAVRSAAALSLLLADGIGDTLRISLCAPPEVEVRVARTLLAALGLRPAAAVVACPTCGRTRAEIAQVAGRVEQRLAASGLELVVAVMGCEVNGPGEARAAELGIAYGSGGQGLVFERGQVVDKLPNEELEAALAARIEARAEEVERSHD
ncbi:MAG: flavodoxin-dependent (E)-4-hydroxy-3-methylbut-2-enyl-diphosphate synthase, partial [Deltaproteobacteria bacterium]|nr:flavodoxin-dependent (E)-4-hydroxy-3-methylbut-2-enyl-diphosphate synthase [Deltaproteobacteria bacterium]